MKGYGADGAERIAGRRRFVIGQRPVETDQPREGLVGVAELTRHLSALWGRHHGGSRLVVTRREVNPYESTFPTEVVTCRSSNGEDVSLFCKYGEGVSHAVYGHRADVAYEAHVYETVLQESPVPAAGYVGTFWTSRGPCLVLEYLGDAVRVSKADERALPQAAAWAGRLHRTWQRAAPANGTGQVSTSRAGTEPGESLLTYNAAYYQGWMERTREYARPVLPDGAWVDTLAAGFNRVTEALTGAGPTVIHGEFYSANILYRDEQVYPIDWESAALAPGEIDLAMLTEGWPADITAHCRSAYVAARWPEGPPESFPKVLSAARIYVLLRWLGDRPDWTAQSAYRFPQLRQECENFGVL